MESSSSQETLKELFNLIDGSKKLSKVKAILKADKTLATARQEDNGKNPLLEAASKNNFEVVKLLITTYNVDVSSFFFQIIKDCLFVKAFFHFNKSHILFYLSVIFTITFATKYCILN